MCCRFICYSDKQECKGHGFLLEKKDKFRRKRKVNDDTALDEVPAKESNSNV